MKFVLVNIRKKLSLFVKGADAAFRRQVGNYFLTDNAISENAEIWHYWLHLDLSFLVKNCLQNLLRKFVFLFWH